MMNRRKFLKGVAAAPMLVPVAALAREESRRGKLEDPIVSFNEGMQEEVENGDGTITIANRARDYSLEEEWMNMNQWTFPIELMSDREMGI